jgi:hypothetical protein
MLSNLTHLPAPIPGLEKSGESKQSTEMETLDIFFLRRIL